VIFPVGLLDYTVGVSFLLLFLFFCSKGKAGLIAKDAMMIANRNVRMTAIHPTMGLPITCANETDCQ
jgi:hypothetical protein